MVKKLVVIAVVGAALVGGIVLAKGASVASSPEGKACTKMADLCGAEGNWKDLNECVDDMKKARKLAGDVPFERTAACIDESKSCAAAAGCWMGGVGVGAAGEMMKGFGTALTK
jgi:hypothetical protein